MLVWPFELQVLGSHRPAVGASRTHLPSRFDFRPSLAWLVGALCLLCFLEEFSGSSWAGGDLVRGTTLARARVLSLPSAQRLRAIEDDWQQLALSLRAELSRGRITSDGAGARLDDFVQHCNDERRKNGDCARYELVTPPGAKAPILQLEWTGN